MQLAFFFWFFGTYGMVRVMAQRELIHMLPSNLAARNLWKAEAFRDQRHIHFLFLEV